jgi:aminoglycoside phosphotransferase (APT) family kinase protein
VILMPTTIKDFPGRLEAFLLEKLGQAVHVCGARQLTGGASRDTWAVDVVVHGAEKHCLVVRRDLGGQIMPDALDRATEFAVLRRAHEAGVLVPRPRWVCMDPGVLGLPFFIMDRLEGESVGRRILRDPDLARARQQMPAQMGEQLAKIHALSLDGLDGLPRPRPGQSPAHLALARTADQLRGLNEPHPVLELVLRWLGQHAPACPRQVLVHGDFRIGNLMVGRDGLVGVFDWEFAHVGDPAEDLAWPCVKSWRFGQDELKLGGVGHPEEFFAAYERGGGTKVDAETVRFWELVGNLRWAVGCIVQAHRHLSGQARSIELASLGRRTCEMELELLDLITQSGTVGCENAVGKQ